MLSLPPSVRVFLCVVPTDMRRSFDSLSGMVREICGEDPLSGHLFVFCNRRADRVKLLYWDRDGYAIWYKRLEEGTFRFPQGETGALEVQPGDLVVLLDGIDLSSVRRHKRYRLKKSEENQKRNREKRSSPCFESLQSV